MLDVERLQFLDLYSFELRLDYFEEDFRVYEFFLFLLLVRGHIKCNDL